MDGIKREIQKKAAKKLPFVFVYLDLVAIAMKKSPFQIYF